ncbi:MAG: six-hairpin glycosidase, partial [Bacteroidales bacterium]|nr:six-hairpin glycosidase [Bacteroidales bacterium]
HYWSCITAQAFATFGQCTNDATYLRRAKDCLMGNLLLFNNQGFGSAAWIYPDYVNGHEAHRANPCANDQDWALVYFLMLYDKVIK